MDTDTDGTIIGSGLMMGGVAGRINAVSATACTNEGEVFFDVNRGGQRAYDNICYGGVIGGNTGAVILSSCENDGYVHGGVNINTSGDGSTGVTWAGGVAGSISGASSISDCINRGPVTNRQYSKINSMNPSSGVTYPGTGGIVGAAVGTSSGHITIANCNLPAGGYAINSRRGAAGGIAAYTDYAEVSGCTVSVNLANQAATVQYEKYDANSFYLGGIVAVANHSTLSGCDMRGNIASSQKKYLGGIVAGAYNSSTVNGCTYKGDIASVTGSGTGYGSVAGFAQKTCTLSNNRFAGTVDGTTMSADTQVTTGSPTLNNNSYDPTLE